MAIDPKMYEKYSGRSGDPYKRMGEALAQQSARKQRVDAAGDRQSDVSHGPAKMKWLFSIIASIVVLIVLATTLFRW